MAKVVRYFHIRPHGCMGGATVKVVGDTTSSNVEIAFSRCSKHDNFCKKIGRSLADSAPVKVIPLRYLPRELDGIALKVVDAITFYDFSIKYFLPKE